LDSGDNVFKMMGPVLLRVEVEDAKQNVGKRLELIKSSM
jgi:chaperonin cofactor prefoldin